MKNKLLLPRICRPIGCILLAFAMTLMIATNCFNYSIPFLKQNIDYPGNYPGEGEFLHSVYYEDNTGTLGTILAYLSLFMVAFSRAKIENEQEEIVRRKSLQISVYAFYLILFLLMLATLVARFKIVLNVFFIIVELNLFTILVLHILIYQYYINIKPRFSKNK